MTAKWSDNSEFPVASTVSLTTTSIVGLVGGANGKFTPTVLQAALTKVGLVTVTQPATGSTLTLVEGSTLATSGAFSITLTSTAATNVTLPTTGTLAITTRATDAFGALTDITTNDASSSAHGFLPKLSNSATDFLTGIGTWAVPAGGGTVTHTGSLTANAIVLGNGTADIKPMASLGTTTTVLHGNAAGAPTFGAVDLSTDVTGALPWTVNAQTGTTYTVQTTDAGLLVTFTNAAAVAVTLPQATSTFATFASTFRNVGNSLVTITPTTSTIGGAAAYVIQPGAEIVITASSGNYVIGVDGAPRNLSVPGSDPSYSGPTTNAFNSGYSSSAIGDLVYLDSSATWQKTDANTLALYNGLLAMALEVKASGSALLVALPGSFVYAATAFPTFTIGGPVFMSETAGAVTQTAPTTTDAATRVVGWAVHADKMYFFPSPDYITHT